MKNTPLCISFAANTVFWLIMERTGELLCLFSHSHFCKHCYKLLQIYMWPFICLKTDVLGLAFEVAAEASVCNSSILYWHCLASQRFLFSTSRLLTASGGTGGRPEGLGHCHSHGRLRGAPGLALAPLRLYMWKDMPLPPTTWLRFTDK